MLLLNLCMALIRKMMKSLLETNESTDARTIDSFKKPIKALTTLRFLAAFIIFLFHFNIHVSPLFNIYLLDNIIDRGAVGMSLFFILSGFVLAYNYDSFFSSFQIRDFYLKRFARIYPAYLFWSIIFFYQLIPHFVASSYSKSIGKGLLVIFTDVFLLQAWFPHFFQLGTNAGTWSLSVEAFLYLVFPLIVLGLNLPQLDKTKLICFFIFSYFITIIPAASYAFFDQFHMGAYSLPFYRLGEFLSGIILCEIYRRNLIQITNKLFVAFFIFFLIVFSFSVESLIGYTTLNFIVVPFFLSLILWCAQLTPEKNLFLWKFLENKTNQYLGKISYSFYLSQALIFSAILPFLEKPHTLFHRLFLFVVFLIINIFCACLSFEFIEKKVYKLICNRYKRLLIIKE